MKDSDINTPLPDLHVEHREGGIYVVGRGFLCPADDEQDAERLIQRLRDRARRREHG